MICLKNHTSQVYLGVFYLARSQIFRNFKKTELYSIFPRSISRRRSLLRKTKTSVVDKIFREAKRSLHSTTLTPRSFTKRLQSNFSEISLGESEIEMVDKFEQEQHD